MLTFQTHSARYQKTTKKSKQVYQKRKKEKKVKWKSNMLLTKKDINCINLNRSLGFPNQKSSSLKLNR